MRQPSEVRAELEAIDATLAGAPVDPQHAELAELALLLNAARPELDGAAAARVDDRVRRAEAPRGRRIGWRSAVAAVAVTAAGALAAVAVLGGGSPSAVPNLATSTSQPGGAVSAPSAAAAGTAQAAPSPASAGQYLRSLGAQAPGRAIVQSAELDLTAAPDAVDRVAGEVFAAVGSAGGYVVSSSVTQTGGPDGAARFSLSLPSAGLSTTMARLSQLPGSTVASRTDTSQDVTDALGALRRQLADAQALRTALLRALSAARTSAEIAGLRGRLHDADAAIGRATDRLRRLEHAVAFSTVNLTVQASSPAPRPAAHRTPVGRGLRVLGDVGGALLLCLVVLVPLALLAVALLWVALRGRRAWRERGL